MAPRLHWIYTVVKTSQIFCYFAICYLGCFILQPDFCYKDTGWWHYWNIPASGLCVIASLSHKDILFKLSLPLPPSTLLSSRLPLSVLWLPTWQFDKDQLCIEICEIPRGRGIWGTPPHCWNHICFCFSALLAIHFLLSLASGIISLYHQGLSMCKTILDHIVSVIKAIKVKIIPYSEKRWHW